MNQIYRYTGMLTAAFVLGACGGGSGGSTPSTTTDTPNGTSQPSTNTPATNTQGTTQPATGTQSNKSLKAVATVTPSTTTQGEVVSFDGSKSTSTKGAIATYLWKEGSKVLSRNASFTTTALNVGLHNISLTVADVDNSQDAVNVAVTIKSASAQALRIIKTGQGRMYVDFDDGHYKKGVTPDFSRANDVVTDSVTGLQWQDNEEAKSVKKTWEEAHTYCTSLTLDGGLWRLPSRKELLSIAYYAGIAPAMHPEFKNVEFEVSYPYYFSASASAGSDTEAWIVSFYNGIQDTVYKSREYYVRCVRTSK